jgi:hypothetical protein
MSVYGEVLLTVDTFSTSRDGAWKRWYAGDQIGLTFLRDSDSAKPGTASPHPNPVGIAAFPFRVALSARLHSHVGFRAWLNMFVAEKMLKTKLTCSFSGYVFAVVADDLSCDVLTLGLEPPGDQ